MRPWLAARPKNKARVLTTTAGITLSLEPGTHAFRTRAQDKAGNWGEWATGSTFTLAATQENGTGVTYPAGTWTRQAVASAYGGYLKYEPDSGRASFSFTGREVARVAHKAGNRGKAEVLVDSVQIATVDLYSSSGQPRQVVFSKEWATSGSHTLVVRLLGTKNASSSGTRVDIDAFVVIR
jgi:hypothetical protein